MEPGMMEKQMCVGGNGSVGLLWSVTEYARGKITVKPGTPAGSVNGITDASTIERWLYMMESNIRGKGGDIFMVGTRPEEVVEIVIGNHIASLAVFASSNTATDTLTKIEEMKSGLTKKVVSILDPNSRENN